jgi:hypothetical protein
VQTRLLAFVRGGGPLAEDFDISEFEEVADVGACLFWFALWFSLLPSTCMNLCTFASFGFAATQKWWNKSPKVSAELRLGSEMYRPVSWVTRFVTCVHGLI